MFIVTSPQRKTTELGFPFFFFFSFFFCCLFWVCSFKNEKNKKTKLFASLFFGVK